MNPAPHAVIVLDVEYRCLALECRHCGTRITEGITTELVHSRHGGHLSSVTIEIEIVSTGEKWEIQPVPPSHSC